jgi:hypothetical protein
MLSRRNLLSGVVVGSRISRADGRGDIDSRATAGFAGFAEPVQMSERSAQEIAQAIKDLRTAIVPPHSFTELQPVRSRQIDHLRSQGKFPDYVEVGVNIWFAIYDWHIRQLQPITLGRDTSGRYTLTLLTTIVVLRIDADPGFVGVPYDAK